MSIKSGVVSLTDWLGEGGKPVSSALSASRADICFHCPHNKPIGWTSMFKEGIAGVVLAYERLRRSAELSTPRDSSLGECSACGCILRLKVHVPLKHLDEAMDEEDFGVLPEHCWVKTENKETNED
jgi:hypothetical protein